MQIIYRGPGTQYISDKKIVSLYGIYSSRNKSLQAIYGT